MAGTKARSCTTVEVQLKSLWEVVVVVAVSSCQMGMSGAFGGVSADWGALFLMSDMV